MRGRKGWRTAAAVAAIAILPQAAPAAGPSITFYANVDFTGASVTYTEAVPDIDAGMALLSARTVGRWQICPRNEFRGACIEADGGVSNLKREFGFFAKASSARPAAAIAPAPAAPATAAAAAPAPVVPAAPATASTPTAAGPTAALFPRPLVAGRPIPAGTAGAAAAFCRAEGFAGVGYSTTAAEGGDAIVADLLCIRPPAR